MSFLDPAGLYSFLEAALPPSELADAPNPFPAESVAAFFRDPSSQDPDQVLGLRSKRVCIDPTLSSDVTAHLPAAAAEDDWKEEEMEQGPDTTLQLAEAEVVQSLALLSSGNQAFNFEALLENHLDDTNNEARFKRLFREKRDLRDKKGVLTKEQQKILKDELERLVPDPNQRQALSKQVRRAALNIKQASLLASKEVVEEFQRQYRTYYLSKASISSELQKVEEDRINGLLPHSKQRQNAKNQVLIGPNGIDLARKQKHDAQRTASNDRKRGSPPLRVVLEGTSLEYYEKLKDSRLAQDEGISAQLEAEAEKLPLGPEIKHKIQLKLTQDLTPSKARERRLGGRRERQLIYRLEVYQTFKRNLERYEKQEVTLELLEQSYRALVGGVLSMEKVSDPCKRIQDIARQVKDIFPEETFSAIELEFLGQTILKRQLRPSEPQSIPNHFPTKVVEPSFSPPVKIELNLGKKSSSSLVLEGDAARYCEALRAARTEPDERTKNEMRKAAGLISLPSDLKAKIQRFVSKEFSS